MTTINFLSPIDEVSGGDQIPVFVTNQGDARRVPVSVLLDYFKQQYPSPQLTANLYTPTTGFALPVPTPTSSQWMQLQPAGTLATGTITLPLNTLTPDGTEVLITTTQTVTALTIALNGATAANGAPTTLAANGFARLRFITSRNSWYRVG
jgi:hypothetical protein